MLIKKALLFIALFLMLTSFLSRENDMVIDQFKFKRSKISLSIINLGKDTVLVPDFYIRGRGLKKRMELRTEFYEVSHDTLFINVSKTPDPSTIQVSDRSDVEIFIEGTYNDIKLPPDAKVLFHFFIDEKYKSAKLNFIQVRYDDLVVLQQNTR
jgi:hypothetical protein